MDVVIVESPAKAKTINKYLGKNFDVLASYGHIRDLPAKDGSVKTDKDFAMDWEVEPAAERRIRDIASAVSKTKNLYLATDPDREGEAIAWHVVQELLARGKLQGVNIKRVVFNQITQSAVLAAMQSPRALDMELVNAYLARRALDYLVGFTLSPVLWRKLPGSKSAGRVQSVALRLVCERENEIEAFKSEEFWTLKGLFETPRSDSFSAKLTHLNGKKLDKFALSNKEKADDALKQTRAASFTVGEIERKRTKRNPAPPFTTSTLQQEAARKLFFSAKKTMQIAQRLYEGVNEAGGLITYMRTDAVRMAPEALKETRSLIEQEFGGKYVPESIRYYKTNTKNAQEAHEAIRPTVLFKKPQDVIHILDKDQYKLYELIWKRTVASQMESAELDKVAADCCTADRKIVFHATGQTIAFDGFLRVYFEGYDDQAGDDEDGALPLLNEKESLKTREIASEQHFTQPPPRYSEASLVKKLEELGIGRPSTYASILSVLQDRNYVRLDQRRFFPEDRGRVVTIFLENYFKKYVQYDFTAHLEELLDQVSEGAVSWKNVLRDFWKDFSENVKTVEPLTITDVLNTLDKALEAHLFPKDESRVCPECKTGRLSLKIGKFGAFIGCSNYPECRYTRPFGTDTGAVVPGEGNPDGTPSSMPLENRELGLDSATNEPVYLKKGPYGFYVQLGKDQPKPVKVKKPRKGAKAGKEEKAETVQDAAAFTMKRTSLPRNIKPEDMNLSSAVALLSLPKTLGKHPKTGDDIQIGIGRFGPYVKFGAAYKSIPASENVLEMTYDKALSLIENVKPRKPAQDLGAHPSDGKPVTLQIGRFGPFVRHGSVMASVPKKIRDEERDPTLEEAVALLAAKSEKSGGDAPKGRGRKAKTAPAKPARKTRTKKT